MRDRFLRLLDPGTELPGLSVESSQLEVSGWLPEEAALTIPRDLELSPRDWAVFLLHTAAEIEHALLVQYLYAAYSIRPSQTLPNGAKTDDWILSILSIAREEMGHLLTLQNVLGTLGGPLNFEREDFPYRSKLYPFPFTLERLSKKSLAKYVAAEMPAIVDSTVLSTAERDEIWIRAMDSAGGEPTNHVGELYRALLSAVAALPASDFRTDRIDLQATLTEGWGDSDDDSPHGVKVISMTSTDAATNQAEALRALRVIALQGEGASSGSVDGSHFKRFLDIYRSIPDSGFEPSFDVPTNPYIPGDSNGRDAIENSTTQLWARLFNVRYRILLTELAHVLNIPPKAGTADTPRGQLIIWIFAEMAGSPASIRELAKRLTQMPRRRPGGPPAGAPLGLPYSLTLPAQGPERWRLHLDLIDASIALIREIEDPPRDVTLKSIYDYEVGRSGRRDIVTGLQNSPF